METVESMISYYQVLKENYESGKPGMKFNKDRAHNSTVQRFMLDISREIKMFCGQLSVFRNGFYNYISEDSNELSEMLKNEIINSLSSFLIKEDSKLIIIFENFKKDYLKDLIVSETFLQGIKDKKILLFKLKDNLKDKKNLNHFSISDKKIVRVEQDKEQHNAVCTINYEESNRVFNIIYDRLLTLAEPIPDNEIDLNQ